MRIEEKTKEQRNNRKVTNMDNMAIDTLIDGFPVGIDMTDSAGSFTGIHFHPFIEIHFIIAGQYKIHMNGSIMMVYTGDVIIIPPELRHSLTPAGDAAHYDRASFWLDTGKLTKKNKPSFILDSLCDIRDITIINQSLYLINMINTVRNEMEYKKPHYIEFIKNEIINIMIYLCRSINEAYNQIQVGQHGRKNIILSVKSYINANYAGDCTLQKVAKELNLNERHLNKLVHKFYSRSFRQLLLDTRMSMANYLIEESDMSFREIAAKTGYSGTSAFYNAYTKYYGKTPADFKKYLSVSD